MLQQTQVDRVVPKFEAFIEVFPDLAALARASEEAVLAQWSGLGYYRRARLLHRLAREVSAGSGVLPESAHGLEELPGIGPYTAAAVASLVHGEAIPVLDGNVLRVASRVLAHSGDPRSSAGRREISAWAKPLVAAGPAGEVNEALMELGATVCTPSSPRCDVCPLSPDCRGRASGRPADFPSPRGARAIESIHWVAACCVDRQGRWLLRVIDEGPILRGLWLPPIAVLEDNDDPVARAMTMAPGTPTGNPEVLPEVHHSITYRRIRVTPVLIRMDAEQAGDEGDRWFTPEEKAIATSSLLDKFIDVSHLESRK
jgi:A/G-specific adenine glycosylase